MTKATWGDNQATWSEKGVHLVPHELQTGGVGVRAWLGLGSD